MKAGNIIAASIKNRRFTIFVTIILSLLGLYSYYLIPKQESPDVAAPIAIISTVYPGASPQEVEKLVTRVIEGKIRKINGYSYSESFSQNHISVVVLQLKSEAAVEKAWTELRSIINDTQAELPTECLPVQINTDLAATAGMIISLSGEQYSSDQLTAYAEEFKKKLAKIEGISRFDINGQLEKAVQVEIAVAKINQSQLSLEDILNVLTAQNISIPSGAIENGTDLINVKIPGSYASLSDIGNTVLGVDPQTGAATRLKDIARIDWQPEANSYSIQQNGKPAVLLSGYFQDNKNIVLVGKKVRAELDQLKSEAPRGLIIDEILYQPDDVSQNISHFLRNLLEGMLLVIIVVLLGMGWKNALVASTAIPLSVLLTFIIMYPLGIKVHEMSIAALIIVLGILVDDAIVMVDAIQVYLDNGVDRLTACLLGVKQAAVPILTATLVIIISFAPIFLLPGAAGEFLLSVPQLVLISLAASYLVAMLVTPTLSYMFFSQTKQAADSILRKFFGRLLSLSMKRKKASLAGTLLIFAMAVYSITYIPLQFFPKADKNIIYINIKATAGSTIEKTGELVDQVEKILAVEPEVVDYSSSIGSGLPKFYVTLPVATQSSDFAQLMLHVNPEQEERFSGNGELANYLQQKINQHIDGGTAKVKLLEKAYPVAPVQLRLSGGDSSLLNEIAQQIKQKLLQIPGTLNVEDDIDKEVKQFVVDVAVDKASMMGISNYDLQRQINIALAGAKASVLRSEGNQYRIYVKSNVKSSADLENLAIKSSVAGNKVFLKDIAQIRMDSQVPSINKYDGEVAVKVVSDVKPGYSAVKIESALKKKLASLDLKGLTLNYDGESKQIVDNFGNLAKAAVFALFFIYLILMIQFRSFIQPLVIFLTLPLALIGSVLGLLVCRQPLSFTAFVGMVSLIGLVIRNAILLIGFINKARADGMSIEAACGDAVERRFRPIILSAVTATIGLLPLALSGSSLFVPLAVALMFGLLVATILTMVIIPVVYSMMVR